MLLGLLGESDSKDEICCVHLTDVGLNGPEFTPETQQDQANASAMDFEDLESFMTWNFCKSLDFTM